MYSSLSNCINVVNIKSHCCCIERSLVPCFFLLLPFSFFFFSHSGQAHAEFCKSYDFGDFGVDLIIIVHLGS